MVTTTNWSWKVFACSNAWFGAWLGEKADSGTVYSNKKLVNVEHAFTQWFLIWKVLLIEQNRRNKITVKFIYRVNVTCRKNLYLTWSRFWYNIKKCKGKFNSTTVNFDWKQHDIYVIKISLPYNYNNYMMVI